MSNSCVTEIIPTTIAATTTEPARTTQSPDVTTTQAPSLPGKVMYKDYI